MFGDLTWVQHYLGSNKPTNGTKSSQIKQQAKIIVDGLSNSDEFYSKINNLYHYGKTFEDLALAAAIFGRGQKFRQNFKLNYLYDWLGYTVGWAEVDSLCQNNFFPDELLATWPKWSRFLIKLSQDKNIHRRRASLVLLCKSLGKSDDVRFLNLAFDNISRLYSEKEVLISKAISWVLRSAVKNHPLAIKKYLEVHRDILPKIAYRETLKKLTTGKKN